MSAKTWSIADQTTIQSFLTRVCGLLPTGQITFQLSEKNNQFDAKFNLRHNEKIEIIKSLNVSDCIKIADNENNRYPDAELFIFTKSAELSNYGEPCETAIYVKMYITERNNMEYTVVVSFHEDGVYEI